MDKFTVDIDQVLNDFEYSELTDQYTTARSPVETSTSLNHNNVTKHSINNVFRSLNEYLNTSVDIPNINTVALLETDENIEIETSQNEVQKEKSLKGGVNITTQENLDVNIHLDKNYPEDDICVAKNSDDDKHADDISLECDVGSKLDKNGYEKEHYLVYDLAEDLKEIIDLVPETLVNLDSKDIINSDSKEVIDLSPVKLINPDPNEIIDLSSVELINPDPEEISNLGSKELINSDPKEITNSDLKEITNLSPKEIINSNLNEINNLDTKEVINSGSGDVINSDSNIQKENLLSEIDDPEKDKQFENSLLTNANDVNIINKEEEVIKNNIVLNCVGFEAITNIEPNEIQELLDELENDEDIIEHKKSQPNDTDYNEETSQPNDTDCNEEKSQPNDTDCNEEKVNKQEQVEEIKNELSKSNPEQTLDDKISRNEDDFEKTIERCEESNKLKEVDKELEKTSHSVEICQNLVQNYRTEEVLQEVEIEDNEGSKFDENLEKTKCNNSLEGTKCNDDLEATKYDDNLDETKGEVALNHVEVVSRPQNLSLKDSEENLREINLVGEPGHTPFNNVYISKEIHKEEEQDNVSISSTSSNTFSDTGTTVSTASTEEIRDDNDVIDTQHNIDVLTENLEEVTKECSDDANNSRNVVEELESNDASFGQAARDEASASGSSERQWLGKEAPLWIPDSDANSCLHCDMKFTVLKRRHHCRACGLVLCSKCCHLRFKLEYLDAEARVCNKCHLILNKDTSSSSSDLSSPDPGNSPLRRPNPNNPLEYCSTLSPLQQVSGASSVPLPAVMVPVGVLKRKGSNKAKSNKSVMFCDGIRPGSDLTNLDNDFNYNNTKTKKLEKTNSTVTAGKINRNLPLIDSDTNSFIPKSDNCLPPLVTITKNEISYTDCPNNPSTVELLKSSQQTFAILLSLYVHVKIINMNCCISKSAWCFSTEGLINVAQDEIVIILEFIDEEQMVPKDIFYHINNIYAEAVKGTSIKELGLSLHNSSNFLDSKNHAGFVYIRPTFQCLENVIKPKETFLIGILIHRWETPWAKLFPLRLILRLGAAYRYYPSPVISTRHRDSVFVEIGHTIINLLADFRNFSYTLPQISGLTIHMEDKNTTVTIPINRYDQVIKSLNNSSDHILAFGGCFSLLADSHLVCIQDTQGNENCYSTHAINIQNKPRKVTGASFIVFNGALKSSSGLMAKSNIVEDGLMIQVLPEHMQQIRDNLRAMKNHTIPCGCVNADTDETVNIVWGDNDTNFNIGVVSSIDNMSLSGIPSIRVHNAKNHYGANGNRIIRWTEVFIIQNSEENPKNQDPVDVSRISENIAKATCDALLNYLDLLVTNNFQKISVRTTLQEDNVSYCAGSNNTKLPPIYMKSLDNELIPVLHRITSSSNLGENAIILELIFRILNV